MHETYSFTPGDTPILVSMPHSGLDVPASIRARLSERARALPDTDWHIPMLYQFVLEQGHAVLRARYSRYVVDLNRPPNDELLYPGRAGTGLCPKTLFDGTALYRSGEAPNATEIAARRENYWRPYHDKLARALAGIRARCGYAILYDAHSIAARVPRLFAGQLPDLNLGTANGASCSAAIERAVYEVLEDSGFSAVRNGRFRGGYITRHYGDPDARVHALQMEISQCTYMGEGEGFPYDSEKAKKLQRVLRRVFAVISGIAYSIANKK